MAEKIWEKLITNIIPILLAAMFSVIGFLAIQILGLNKEIGRFRTEELRHYMDLDKRIALQEVTISNLKTRLDRQEVGDREYKTGNFLGSNDDFSNSLGSLRYYSSRNGGRTKDL